jgi:uncharacterized protein (TIGR02265 family)
MKIKGLTIKTTPEFVKKRFPERYREWLDALPSGSKKIMTEHIVVNEWYPIRDALTVPLRKVGEVFYENNWKKAVWDLGRYDAEDSLTGIYKIYVKLGSPGHLISRAGRIMAAYYSDAEIKVAQTDKKSIALQIVKFDEPDEAVEYNMAGWIQRALEISGCKNVEIEIPKSLARRDAVTEFRICWQ